MENLTVYDDIVCDFNLTESWISPDYSYEFNVVYVLREKLQYLLYYNNIWSADFQDEKQNKVTIKRHFVYHFIVYICLFVGVNLLQ